mgnify:CR=1 FL=1
MSHIIQYNDSIDPIPCKFHINRDILYQIHEYKAGSINDFVFITENGKNRLPLKDDRFLSAPAGTTFTIIMKSNRGKFNFTTFPYSDCTALQGDIVKGAVKQFNISSGMCFKSCRFRHL